jgi:hypothetical protein
MIVLPTLPLCRLFTTGSIHFINEVQGIEMKEPSAFVGLTTLKKIVGRKW